MYPHYNSVITGVSPLYSVITGVSPLYSVITGVLYSVITGVSPLYSVIIDCPSLGQGVGATEEEDDDSDDSDDEDDLCAPGDHDWSTSRCVVCKICKYCTGYGPSCCNDGLPGREPGK